jgi:hypothetical protein
MNNESLLSSLEKLTSAIQVKVEKCRNTKSIRLFIVISNQNWMQAKFSTKKHSIVSLRVVAELRDNEKE